MSSFPWKWTILAGFVAFLVRNVLDFIRPFKAPLPTNDASKCKLYKGPTGAEDMVLAGNWIITSSLDTDHLVNEGVKACARDTGGLWLFPVDAHVPPTRLDIEGIPDDVQYCFMTHGLFLSNTSNRLYAVTHHGSYSSVEIFQLHYHVDAGNKPSLTWVRSVTSDSFLNMGPNDVVEGITAGELYVTQFLPFSIPPFGLEHPETMVEKVQQYLLFPALLLLGLKLTTVHQCTFVDDSNVLADCHIASRTRFKLANGIAISKDRSKLFVNDVTSHTIVVFERLESGMLHQTDTIQLIHAVDNIEYKFDNSGMEELWMGTLPDMLATLTNVKNKPTEQQSIVPGGLAVVTKETNGTWGKQRVVYNHDGSMLSKVSFGIAHGSKVFLGSPSSSGILVCEEQ